jgi:SAM-dependent methyltransferase
MATAGHRRFAALWDWTSRHEGRTERTFRDEVVRGAAGNVLEIGYGVGSNWPFLPAGTDYTGIEPDPYMRERAEHHLPKGRELALVDGDAQAMQFGDATFDTVIGTLVFCTIPDADRALAEVRRVLKPGGEFRFWEHVRSRGRAGSAFQTALTPLWKRLGGGCHLNRDTEAAIKRAGFDLVDLRHVKIGPLPAIVGTAKLAEKGAASERP